MGLRIIRTFDNPTGVMSPTAMDAGRPSIPPPRNSHDSATSGSNGLSISPSSLLSDDHHVSHRQSTTSFSTIYSEVDSVEERTSHNTSVTDDSHETTKKVHVVHLSSIEHCMPRAYIRVCLAYRMPESADLADVMERLNAFARKLVDAKPYLAGWVASSKSGKQVGFAEIQFTEQDFLEYPDVQVRHLSHEEVPHTYDELGKMGMPPSVLRPDLVSALPEGTDEDYAPIFRMQANVVSGGIVVSVYLHHCISDGAGLGSLVSGRVLKDDFTFDRHRIKMYPGGPSLDTRLGRFAAKKSTVRQKLSHSDPRPNADRHLVWRPVKSPPDSTRKPRPPGRGCILAFPRARLDTLKSLLTKSASPNFVSTMDPLHALLWVHMTLARLPSIIDPSVTTSKLLIPINLRGSKKFADPVSTSYFGAAVDFAEARLPLSEFSIYTRDNPETLSSAAVAIRQAIDRVDEAYTRQLIALARQPDPDIDVRDLMASNMNRTDGADMYITSWSKLKLYESTLELGLGKPQWVRKPWSRDPGSCVVLPDDCRREDIEVLVQMTEEDMERLLGDAMFMEFVTRVVD